MRVPYSPIGDTKPSTQGLTYAKDYSDLAAQPWKQVAAALTGLGGQLKARESSDQNLDAIEKFADFQLKWDAQGAEMDNSVEPNDINHIERKQAAFDNMAGQFLQKVAPEKRKEYESRIAQYRTGQAAQTLNFDYKQKDIWYRSVVAKTYTQAQIEFDKNPTPENLEIQQGKIRESLDATNLNETEKNKIADETSLGMLSLSYKKDYEKVARGEPGTFKGNGADLPIITKKQAGRVSAGSTEGVNPELISRFKATQNAFGKSIPIISGKRDEKLNKAAGGADKSEHLGGGAIDIDTSGMSQAERSKLISTATANGITGIGVYENALHFDVGSQRAWGSDRTRKSLPGWAEAAIGNPGAAGKPRIGKLSTDELINRQFQVESGWNQNAVSNKGARGIAQVMPATGPEAAKFAGLPWRPELFNGTGENAAAYNVALGKGYMNEMLRQFNGNQAFALAAYNAGPTRTREAINKYGDDWLAHMPEETQGYVSKILLGDAAGQSSVDYDPQYAQVPLDVRQQIQSDVDRSIKAQQTAETAASRERHDAFLSTLYTDVSRGKIGTQSLNQMLDDGKIDYDEFSKGQSIIDKGTEESKSLIAAQGRRTGGLPLNSEQQGVIYKGEGGQDKTWGMDTGFVGAQLSQAKQSGAVAPGFISDLKAMFMGTDGKRALFAIDSLNQLRQASNNAFGSLDQTTQNAVNLYHELSKTIPKDEVLAKLRGGLNPTPEEMQQTQVLLDRGSAEFAKQDVGIAAGGEKLASLGDLPNATHAGPAWWGWYRAQWTMNFALTGGDAKKATTITNATADDVWKVTEVGGRRSLMRNAPEAVGLPTVDGSIDWFTTAIRRQLGLGPEGTAQVYSDNQTQKEVDAFKQGGPAPSWPVIVFSPNGIPRVTGQRVKGELPSDFQTLNDRDYTLRDLDAKISRFEQYVLSPAFGADMSPEVQELQKEYEALREQRAKLAEDNEVMRKSLQDTTPAEPMYDEMGNVIGQ